MARRTVRVSDRALVKFLARAGGFEVEPLRTAIEGSLKRAMAAADQMDAVELTIHADGLRYVVVNGVVTTIDDVVKRPARATGLRGKTGRVIIDENVRR